MAEEHLICVVCGQVCSWWRANLVEWGGHKYACEGDCYKAHKTQQALERMR